MMSFWHIKSHGGKTAIRLGSQGGMTYDQLSEEVGEFIDLLPVANAKQLGVVLCSNTVASIAAYLAGLQSNHAVMLLDSKINADFFRSIVEIYQPNWIFSKDQNMVIQGYSVREERSGYQLWIRNEQSHTVAIHPNLALLLSTSGTTGTSKFIRLSYKNLQSNAESIAEYLSLDETERAITTLPMSYSFGLSVLNSHLHIGGSIVLTEEPIVSKAFWELFKSERATSLSGVPYTYQIMDRLGFDRMELPSLRYFTQAGGRLALDLVQRFHATAEARQYRFYVMYGQTEATARISYVPPERLADKVGSIGVPIPSGSLSIDLTTTELIYEGPNVMLGYSNGRDDLSKGDELNGRLRTGDIAEVDDEGYYYVRGRMNRFIKLFGLRLSLDDIEKAIEGEFHINAACVDQDDRLDIIIEKTDVAISEVKQFISRCYNIHHSYIGVTYIGAFPRLENGKIHYNRLREMMK